MSNNLGTFLDEWLGTVIPAVWSEIVVPGGASYSNFFTSMQAARLNIIETFEQHPSVQEYHVLVYGKQTLDPDWTMDTAFYRLPIQAFYMARPSATITQEYVHAKLMALSDYLTGPALHTFQTFMAPEVGSIDTSETSPINNAVWVNSQDGILGGHLFYNPGLLTAFSSS